MKYLVIITLTVLFAGCVTINKTYLPASKKDTAYLPCDKPHIQYPVQMPRPNWNVPNFQYAFPKIDTLKYLYDSTNHYGSIDTGYFRLRYSQKGG